jgi:hypothetical protein
LAREFVHLLHNVLSKCLYHDLADGKFSAALEQSRKDEAIAEADTLLLTVPNQLSVAYNAHVLEVILMTIAPLSVGAES